MGKRSMPPKESAEWVVEYRRRHMEGIQNAKKRGVKLGRPHLPLSEEFYVLADMWLRGKITSTAAADVLGISADTFRRWVHTEFSREGD